MVIHLSLFSEDIWTPASEDVLSSATLAAGSRLLLPVLHPNKPQALLAILRWRIRGSDWWLRRETGLPWVEIPKRIIPKVIVSKADLTSHAVGAIVDSTAAYPIH